MNEELKAKVDALKSEVSRHLAIAHEGTALHAILSALDMILAGSPERDEPVLENTETV